MANGVLKIRTHADLLILDAKDEKEVIRLTSECIYVIRNRNIISETTPAKRLLKLDEDEFKIDFKI